MKSRGRVGRALGLLLRLLILAVLLACMLLLAGQDLAETRRLRRGMESGLAKAQAPLQEPRFAVNVSLERYPDEAALRATLKAIRQAGFGAVRQRFPWAELEPSPGTWRWERWDAMVPLVQEEGLQLIAVLDTSPPWARPAGEEDNPWAPPAMLEDYARFVGAFAGRYGRWVLAYQVWDQPNIAPHWGRGEVDPAGYVRLLRLASEAIRRADADALIIAGALAPNIEPGGRNLNDVAFLREIYRRGAGAYFDILGVKAYGFWSGPDDRRVEPQVLNFSRLILLREEMRRRGEAAKPIWALEMGWCALPEDWQGRPSLQGSDLTLIQDQRLARAILRAQQEWPWLGLMTVLHWQPNAAPDDPLWGYSWLDPSGQPRPGWNATRAAIAGDGVLYPGLHVQVAPYGRPIPETDLVDYTFWGTDLRLQVERGRTSGELVIAVDDWPRNIRIRLEAPQPQTVWVRVGGRLPLRAHQLRLYGRPEQLAALRAMQVGHRPPWHGLAERLALAALAAGWCVWALWVTARRLPWREAWRAVRARWLAAPGWLQAGAVVATGLAVVYSPANLIRLVCLALYGLSALLRPDLALAMTLLTIPLAPIHIALGPGSFSLAEIALLVAVAAHGGDGLLRPPAAQRLGWRERLRHWSALDWLVLALVLLGLGTSLWAEYRRVALREWRVVLLEPALLYAMLRARRDPPQRLLAWLDLLWAASVGVALYALWLYPRPEGVIAAEGVRRARAFYGSPNNLALYLDRLLPLGLALAAWGRTRWRRWFYGLGSLPVAVAIFLSFSRGALLVGVPAALLTLAWLAESKRVRWLALALLVVGLLALVPLARTERFASLLDTSQGTTFLRLSLWQAAWDMIRDHPWLGVGPDNFLYYYGDYLRPGAEVDRWLSHPHNWLLDFWLRLGLGGVILFLGLLAAFARRAWHLYRGQLPGDARAATLGLLGGMAALVAHGSMDQAFFVAELAFWCLFALAWVGVLAQPDGAGCHQEADAYNDAETAESGHDMGKAP